MRFPLELPLGKHVPLYGGIPGRSFRLRRHPETTSQSERGFRDGLSASHSFGNCIPFRMRIPGCGFHLMCHPDTTSQSERGFRDVLSAWAAIGKARPGLRCQGVFFTPAPCSEFDSPRFGACVGAGHGQPELNRHRIYIWSRLCAENPRICFANPHRLRPPAGVLARGLKTLTRFLYARALHRVRFSAVRTRNKKAGRYKYLPACYLWWRRGESNSGPRKPPDWHLQAQSLV